MNHPSTTKYYMNKKPSLDPIRMQADFAMYEEKHRQEQEIIDAEYNILTHCKIKQPLPRQTPQKPFRQVSFDNKGYYTPSGHPIATKVLNSTLRIGRFLTRT